MTELQVEQAAKRRRIAFPSKLSGWASMSLAWVIVAAWQVLRCAICAVLVLGEPLMRAVLVPLAFLGFLVTMIFGFLIGDPRFPRWGMLAFSVGALVLYWAYLWLMGLFMSLPAHDYHR